ncbi:hypothetical protein [Aeromonas sp. AE23HZ002T15]
MFLFDLSVALHVPIHEVKNWPQDIIDQYKAYNHLKPFTKNTEHQMMGFMIEILRNQNITKKHQYKTAEQMMPFLRGGLPAYLDDERLVLLRQQIGGILTDYARQDILGCILEEVQIQAQMPVRDEYFIQELIKIYHQHNNKNNKGSDEPSNEEE